MTPEEARELLKIFDEHPQRVRRYVAAGGQRQIWKCDCPCGCCTEAETEWGAAKNLRAFSSLGRRVCVSTRPTPTGVFVPPYDWQ